MIRYIVLLLVAVTPLSSRADIEIFACEPEWAALAEEIGGDLVDATRLCRRQCQLQALNPLNPFGRIDVALVWGLVLASCESEWTDSTPSRRAT